MNRLIIRILDVTFSCAGLVSLSPIIAVLLVINFIVFDGAPIFLQERIGRNGARFTIFKFRTLPISTPNVPSHELKLEKLSLYGKFLRLTKLDELPQLLNVLLGEMSLVGPRPCLPSQKEMIRLREAAGVLAIRPGITGLAQLKHIHMEFPDRVVELDREMQLNLDPVRYCKILLATVFQVVGLRGVR